MLSKNISMKTELNEKIKKALLKELTIKANVKILNIIGKGGMGEIYNAQFGKYLIAIKIIYKKPNQDVNNYLSACRAESYFTSLSLHENIIKTIGSNKVEIGNDMLYYIAMEKAVNRDLNVLIQSHTNERFYDSFIPFKMLNDNFCRFFFLQFCKGYLCLYQSKAVHFDIKPENLLLSKDFVVKIADFSLCHYIKKIEKTYIPPTSTSSYMPLESYKGKEITVDQIYKVDLYAFGVVLYFMKFAKRFIDTKELGKNFDPEQRIKESKEKFTKNKDITEECKQFFEEMTELKYEKRIDIIEFLQHKWIHKNSKIINDIVKVNDGEQRKFCLELQKLDYYINDIQTINTYTYYLQKKINENSKKFRIKHFKPYHKYILSYKRRNKN